MAFRDEGEKEAGRDGEEEKIKKRRFALSAI